MQPIGGHNLESWSILAPQLKDEERLKISKMISKAAWVRIEKGGGHKFGQLGVKGTITKIISF